jgi:type I restriction enzyme M protein
MDLRRWGSEYEKKYVQLTEQDIEKVALNYHNWQQAGFETTYKDIPEFCKSASFEEIEARRNKVFFHTKTTNFCNH